MTQKEYEEDIKAEYNRDIVEKNAIHKNLKKKQLVIKNKFKNEMCKANACTIPATRRDGTSIRTKTTAYDMPYVPSMKSLPCTSFSEETLQMNFKNKTVCSSNQKCSKKNLKLMQNEVEIIKNISTEDKLFKNLNYYENKTKIATDTENNISLTDFDNVDIISEDQVQVKSVSTEESYSKNIINCVKSSQSFFDSKPTNSIIFESQQSCSSNESGEKASKLKQDTFDGSSNNNQNSTLNQYTNNIKKKYGRQELNVVHKQTSNEHHNKNHEKKKQTLVIFDCNKYPLTNSQGKTLKTASGKNLVKYRHGKPYDCFGRVVFDPSGNPSSSKKFKPFLSVSKNKKIISSIPLFDFRGYCLIDFDGSSLTNADGKNLIQVDNKGKILHDINKHPIFDKHGIPITKQNGFWLSPKGTPMRLFHKTKHPLTNKHGEPLRDIKFQELLKCDQHGRPLFDCNNEPIFDATGTSATESKFNPTREPLKSGIILIVMLENKPAQLFNRKGWPLTEKNGEVMYNSKGHCLLMLKKVYPNEITDYDQLLFRLNDPVPLTEICLYLPETKLTREDEIKTNNQDLKKKKIVLDFVGHPLTDRFKGNVLDRNGRKVFLNIKPYFMGNRNGPSSTNIYVSDDAYTIRTLNSTKAKMSKLKLDSISFSADVISFQAETDLFGRPLYDSFNRPLFDKYGRPMYDLFGRSIYDSKGRPIATAEAIRLDNGLDEPPGIKIGIDMSSLVSKDPNNLPKITDLNGGPLFDSLGFPLYNKKGKPIIDAYGRPLYDENGLPHCDEEGRPISKLVKQRNACILSVEDKIETLLLSPLRRYPVKKSSIHDRVTTQYKTTHEDFKIHHNEDLDVPQLTKSLIVRIRVTTFTNGKKYFEILESVPSP